MKESILTFLVTIGVTNFGIGYICNIITVGLAFKSERIRFADRFKRLAMALYPGIPLECMSKGDRSNLREEVLAEFHVRLHSRAPQSFIDFCTRRNTSWYVAINSCVAIVIGCFFAVFIIWWNILWKPGVFAPMIMDAWEWIKVVLWTIIAPGIALYFIVWMLVEAR